LLKTADDIHPIVDANTARRHQKHTIVLTLTQDESTKLNSFMCYCKKTSAWRCHLSISIRR